MEIRAGLKTIARRFETWCYRHPAIIESRQQRRTLLEDPEVKKAWDRGYWRHVAVVYGAVFSFVGLLFGSVKVYSYFL